MAIMYMLVGNIGTGKTTTAEELRDENTLYISEDLLAPMLNDGRYDQGVWTKAHFRVYKKLKLAAIGAALENGFDLILDGTNIAVENRIKYIEEAKQYNATIICYALLDYEYGLKNRIRNNRGTSAETWTEVSNKIQKQFEMPTREEGFDKVIKIHRHPPVNKKL